MPIEPLGGWTEDEFLEILQQDEVEMVFEMLYHVVREHVFRIHAGVITIFGEVPQCQQQFPDLCTMVTGRIDALLYMLDVTFARGLPGRFLPESSEE